MTQQHPEQENQQEEIAPKASLFAVVAGIIMVAVYIGMAFLLTFTNFFTGRMPHWVRYMMAVVFFVYGIFRGYRVYASMKGKL